ncbi:MAG: hypothetical protein ACFCUE_06790 [Candidatus Bathyarchaeia archaeon]
METSLYFLEGKEEPNPKAVAFVPVNDYSINWVLLAIIAAA